MFEVFSNAEVETTFDRNPDLLTKNVSCGVASQSAQEMCQGLMFFQLPVLFVTMWHTSSCLQSRLLKSLKTSAGLPALGVTALTVSAAWVDKWAYIVICCCCSSHLAFCCYLSRTIFGLAL